MHGETDEEKLLATRCIGIKNCKRLGQFNSRRIRPISVELTYKEDNRFDLEKGVYVDHEYPIETE